MVRTCGFAGIGEADAFKLSAFEGLIEFMTREFDVRGFVVSQSDCDSMYAIVLAKLVAQRGAPYWSKAVIHKAQWSASERKKSVKKVLSSVFRVGNRCGQASRFVFEAMCRSDSNIPFFRYESEKKREIC